MEYLKVFDNLLRSHWMLWCGPPSSGETVVVRAMFAVRNVVEAIYDATKDL